MLMQLRSNTTRNRPTERRYDFICNWIGNKAWTVALDWKHGKEFAAASDDEWSVAGEVAGLRRSVAGFSLVQVYDAGHMVPLDQPKNALAMVNAFTGVGSWASSSTN